MDLRSKSAGAGLRFTLCNLCGSVNVYDENSHSGACSKEFSLFCFSVPGTISLRLFIDRQSRDSE